MALIPEDAKAKLERHFAEQLDKPVALTLFVRGSTQVSENNESPVGASLEALELLREVSALSEKLTFQLFDLAFSTDVRPRDEIPVPTILIDRELFRQDPDDGTPARGIPAGSAGIRYVGLPSGNEFPNFIQLLVDVSRRDSGLTEESRKVLSELKAPMHLRVFVTPT